MREPNKDRLRLVVAALRSDRFLQGFGRLAYEDPSDGRWRHCCLGVMCEVAMDNGLDLTATVAYAPGIKADVKRYNGDSMLLPELVVRWYGVGESNPHIGVDHSRGSMSEHNDSRGSDFRHIATLLEQEFEL